MLKRYYYLIHLEFLGFRYHGWQKQPQVKTIQHMLDRTLNFIFEHDQFKTLGASRTDAMVSAHHHLSELFTYHELDPSELLQKLNKYLPADIRALEVEEVSQDFNIISSPKKKEYHYYFSYGEKAHPFSAPFIVNYQDQLDIKLMTECAQLFEGQHFFKQYCHRPNDSKNFNRYLDTCRILPNKHFTASFFPKETYYLKVIGSGFLHHQIRLIMGTLINVGHNKMAKDEISESLQENYQGKPTSFIAPASGLHLIKNEFIDE